MSDPIASLRALHEEATEGALPWLRLPLHLTAPNDKGVIEAWQADGDWAFAADSDFASLLAAAVNNLLALLDAAELLRRMHGSHTARRPTFAEIDAVLSRLHVEDTP